MLELGFVQFLIRGLPTAVVGYRVQEFARRFPLFPWANRIGAAVVDKINHPVAVRAATLRR